MNKILLDPEELVLFKPVYVVGVDGNVIKDCINQISIGDNSYVNTILLKDMSYLDLKLVQEGQKFYLVQNKMASQVFFDKLSAYEYAISITKKKFEEKKFQLEKVQTEFNKIKNLLDCLNVEYKLKKEAE